MVDFENLSLSQLFTSEFRIDRKEGVIKRNGITVSKSYDEIQPVKIGNIFALIALKDGEKLFILFDTNKGKFIESEARAKEFYFDEEIKYFVGVFSNVAFRLFDYITGKFIGGYYKKIFFKG